MLRNILGYCLPEPFECIKLLEFLYLYRANM